MLTSFVCGAAGTAICMAISIAVMVATHRTGHFGAREWLIASAIVVATSAVVGGIAVICYWLQPRDRWGRRKPVDPTDILPFV